MAATVAALTCTAAPRLEVANAIGVGALNDAGFHAQNLTRFGADRERRLRRQIRLEVKENRSRRHASDPVIDGAFAFTHTRLQRLFRHLFMGAQQHATGQEMEPHESAERACITIAEGGGQKWRAQA